MTEQTELKELCFICRKPVVWCDTIPDEGEYHECDQIRCEHCKYNIVFDDQKDRECFSDLKKDVAEKWNTRPSIWHDIDTKSVNIYPDVEQYVLVQMNDGGVMLHKYTGARMAFRLTVKCWARIDDILKLG